MLETVGLNAVIAQLDHGLDRRLRLPVDRRRPGTVQVDFEPRCGEVDGGIADPQPLIGEWIFLTEPLGIGESSQRLNLSSQFVSCMNRSGDDRGALIDFSNR